MAKKRTNLKWGSATNPKRKSTVWWVSLDKRCKPDCCEYATAIAVELSGGKHKMARMWCGCVIAAFTHRRHRPRCSMSLVQYRARFANAPKLERGGPPVKVRLRMEVV